MLRIKRGALYSALQYQNVNAHIMCTRLTIYALAQACVLSPCDRFFPFLFYYYFFLFYSLYLFRLCRASCPVRIRISCVSVPFFPYESTFLRVYFPCLLCTCISLCVYADILFVYTGVRVLSVRFLYVSRVSGVCMCRMFCVP